MGRTSECHGPWLSRWIQRDGPNYRRSSVCSSSVGVILQNQSINKYPASVPSVQAPSWQNTLQFWRQVDVFRKCNFLLVCVFPVFHQPLLAQNPLCSSCSIPTLTIPSQLHPPMVLAVISIISREGISPISILCFSGYSYFVLSKELTLLCPHSSQLSSHLLSKGELTGGQIPPQTRSACCSHQ